MTVPDKARRYLDRMPPAISGAGGHNQTFRVACVLVQGFGLSNSEARPLMVEYSTRCQPPWTEREIDHKLADAECVQEPKGRGYLLAQTARRTPRQGAPIATPRPSPQPAPPHKPAPARYPTEGPVALPKPLPDGARELLLAAFAPGEGIRLAMARTNDDGREVPKDAGLVLSREEWLAKLDSAQGDPNKFLRSTDRNGLFISINPLKLGGSRDSDVTAWRHCLLEFDDISQEEQWSIIQQSRIPATSVIFSGGRSLHAWVRIDAQNRAEYDDRVKLLYAHFANYRPDEKNRNPSRFSRLPNCVRFDKRQELLALNIGAESFTAWQMEQELEDLGEEISIESLLEFDPDKDGDSILGHRWLCRRSSCVWVSQSGTGKSTLEMQAAILWALARPAFTIAPAQALRSLIIQAENDKGDTAEMFQGVWLGLNLGDSPDLIRQVKDNVIIRRIDTHTGQRFLEALQRLIDRFRPDLVWIDPLNAYVGDDLTRQTVVAQFFRDGLNRIAKAAGVTWMIMHHTTKPTKDSKAKSNWTISDYAYEGAGASDLTNWSREVVLLKRFDQVLFQLLFTKRGKRAGLRDPSGNLRDAENRKHTSIWIKHSEYGQCWLQAEPPTEDQVQQAKSKRPAAPGRKKTEFEFDAFLDSIRGEHFTVTQLAERITQFSGVSERTAWRAIIPELKKRMRFDQSFKTYSLTH